MTDEATQEMTSTEPAPVLTCLVELPGGELLRFTDHAAALASPVVPSTARVWSRATFIANALVQPHQALYDELRAPQPDDPKDLDDANWPPVWKGRLYDALLARAWTPEQAATDPGVLAQLEGKMAKRASKTNGGTPRGANKAPKAPRAPKADGEGKIAARVYHYTGDLKELGKGQEATLLGLFKAVGSRKLARADLLTQAAAALPAGKQPAVKVVAFYLTKWKRDGHLTVS